MMFPAIFLDKDGTLIEDVPYNVDPRKIHLMPGVAEGLGLLQDAGYRLVVASNQSGVARGLFPESALAGVERSLRELLAMAGVSLNGWYVCPHHPAGVVAEYSFACDCRKPSPGMLLRATKELSLDISRSWMIGDSLTDVEAGQRAGCKTVWIHEEYGRSSALSARPDHVTRNFAAAARLILATSDRTELAG